MSKMTCDIYQDLIALYVDGLCSEDSGKAVEEHIKACKKCADAYGQMKNEIKVSEISDEEQEENSEFKLNLSKTWKRFKRNIFLKVIAAVIALGIIITSVYCLFIKSCQLPWDKVRFENICMLSDGSVAFEVIPESGKKGDVKVIDIGGTFYVTCFSPLINFTDYVSEPSSYIRIEPETDPYETGTPDSVHECEAIYYGDIYGHHDLIWEKGTELPKASDELEEEFEFLIEN